jgi:monoamine oxidase
LRELFDEIPDETARRYLEVSSRSDSCDPHLTSGISGVKDILMEDAGYASTYSIEGGIERLVDRLRDTISADIKLETPVVSVARTERGTYRLTTRHKRRHELHEFDVVVFALPNYWLARIAWANADLRMDMQEHLMHYDKPAHYLRITVLFKEPFWRNQITGSYFMLDAFGGCCVYDESARHPHQSHGVLGWLIAGNDALSLSNLSDQELVNMALDSLPEPLAVGRQLYVEGRVHRWVGTVNALPGGYPAHDLETRHFPSDEDQLLVVGDYLFDSTLNGVIDSAEYVAESIAEICGERSAAPSAGDTVAAAEMDKIRERA